MKYFKLTSETKVNALGITLFRLELTVDCKWGKAGDKGGWVESEITRNGNVRVSGDAWVSGDAEVYGNARVSGNAEVYGDAWVYGNAEVSGNARVYGNAWEESPLQIQGSKHFFNVATSVKIQIGCNSYTAKKWLEIYAGVGKLAGYTEAQIVEYKAYIDLAVQLGKVTLDEDENDLG